MLYIGNSEIRNTFDLLGVSEDSITLAIAWAMERSPHFLAAFLNRAGISVDGNEGEIGLVIHRYESGRGITDLEISLPPKFHVVVEAKRGWVLPGVEQLELYASRESFSPRIAHIRKMISLSECSSEYAKQHLPTKVGDDVPVIHASWHDLVADAEAVMPLSGNHEKRMLSEFVEYIGGVMTEQAHSNLVYVVSLGGGSPEHWATSWYDIVNVHRRYFHPVGNNWPRVPPTYMGFRYRGQLQSIHFVESYEVIDDLSVAVPGEPKTETTPHFMYKLGEPIVPPHAVLNGNVYPSGRVWCAIDTLLTCRSVSEARDVTQQRGGA